MHILEAMESRHSVRSYLDKPINPLVIDTLRREIEVCNEEGCLHIQLMTDEPEAFGGFMAHYGKITGVQNYIALVGQRADDLDERVGYYGERLVLLAQSLGLNSCWIAATYSKRKSKCSVARGEKLVCVIALGYGATCGTPHKSKPMEQLMKCEGTAPAWFIRGMEAALLAPTAINQQRFLITLSDDGVDAKSLGGPCTKIDLGIVKYHFEIGAGKDSFFWK